MAACLLQERRALVRNQGTGSPQIGSRRQRGRPTGSGRGGRNEKNSMLGPPSPPTRRAFARFAPRVMALFLKEWGQALPSSIRATLPLTIPNGGCLVFPAHPDPTARGAARHPARRPGAAGP